jgi:hypothetical protein
MNARVKGEKEKERQRADTLKGRGKKEKSGNWGQNASAKKLSANARDKERPKQES